MGFPSFNSAHIPFSSFVCGLVDAPAMPLHCSCYDIIHSCLFVCYYFWACRLKRLPCPFLILFFLLVFTAQHFCWASSFNTSGFLNPFHSLGLLISFHSFLPFSFLWALAKSFGLPWPNYHIICLWSLLAFEPIPFTNSFLWAPLASFYFLSIFYDFHGLITSFFGASSARLLSLEPLIILWTYEPLFLLSWPNGLYFAAFFLHNFHIVGFLLLLGHFVKNGYQQ